MPEVITTLAYTFDELNDEAKEKARDKHRDWYTQDDWWDYTYENANRMGAAMGFFNMEIQFSGFCSQDDGASFSANYVNTAGAVDAIKSMCNDMGLLRIAKEITALQIATKLQIGYFFDKDVIVQRLGNSVHSGCMVTGFDDNEYPDEIQTAMRETDLEFQNLTRSFADWIYNQLEAEYNYLASDEHLNEVLPESHLRFDEDGSTL